MTGWGSVHFRKLHDLFMSFPISDQVSASKTDTDTVTGKVESEKYTSEHVTTQTTSINTVDIFNLILFVAAAVMLLAYSIFNKSFVCPYPLQWLTYWMTGGSNSLSSPSVSSVSSYICSSCCADSRRYVSLDDASRNVSNSIGVDATHSSSCRFHKCNSEYKCSAVTGSVSSKVEKSTNFQAPSVYGYGSVQAVSASIRNTFQAQRRSRGIVGEISVASESKGDDISDEVSMSRSKSVLDI